VVFVVGWERSDFVSTACFLVGIDFGAGGRAVGRADLLDPVAIVAPVDRVTDVRAALVAIACVLPQL
jgi:hypothetical protein